VLPLGYREQHNAEAFLSADRRQTIVPAAPRPSLQRTLRMSRAINVEATVEAIDKLCASLGIAISSIEPLDSGGTRVVLKTIEGATKLRVRAKIKVIKGAVVRSGLYQARTPIPYD
jgi:hypothetical protein